MGKMKEVLENIRKEVEELEIGQALDEAVGVEVYKLRKVSKVRKVREPLSKKVLGESAWVSADNRPILLPKFSTVDFVATLTLEATDAVVSIRRYGNGLYEYENLKDYEGIVLTGKSMAEVVAKGTLFTARANKFAKGE